MMTTDFSKYPRHLQHIRIEDVDPHPPTKFYKLGDSKTGIDPIYIKEPPKEIMEKSEPLTLLQFLDCFSGLSYVAFTDEVLTLPTITFGRRRHDIIWKHDSKDDTLTVYTNYCDPS